MSDDSPGWSFIRSRRWAGYGVMLLVFSIACVWLGNWQFDRRAEARQEISRIDRNYDAPAAPLDEVLPDPESFDEDNQKWRTVEMTGRYEGEAYLARNRPGPAGVGSDIIQAFRTTEGRVLFVDRGWVPVNGDQAAADPDTRAQLPKAPEGTVTVQARLRASEPRIAGRTSSGITVGSIDAEALAEQSGTSTDTTTSAYGMLISEDPAGEHGALPKRPPRDEGPHLSYALQWYIFIAIAAIGVAYAARREHRNLNDASAVADETARAARRARRNERSDNEEEDALIDQRTGGA